MEWNWNWGRKKKTPEVTDDMNCYMRKREGGRGMVGTYREEKGEGRREVSWRGGWVLAQLENCV